MSKPAQFVPKHLGLILDGNRRWARENNMPTYEGHRIGYQNLKTIGQAGLDRGIEVVSAYVFSTENWDRSKEEVGYLMKLLQHALTNELMELHEKGIRIRVLGMRDRIPARLLEAIDEAEKLTAENTAGTLALCLNYGGTHEIVDAVNAIQTANEEVSVESIAQHLYAPDLPPVDFIIRTSGEHRISNFMLWRAAYSELYFANKHWPEFTEADLDEALAEYGRRERRFGK